MDGVWGGVMTTEAIESEASRRMDRDMREMTVERFTLAWETMDTERREAIAEAIRIGADNDWHMVATTLMTALRAHLYEFWLAELVAEDWDGNWRKPDRTSDIGE